MESSRKGSRSHEESKERTVSENVDLDASKRRTRKWASFWTRTVTATILLSFLFMFLWLGHIALSLMVNVVQALLFRELIFTGIKQCSSKRFFFFYRVIHWYFFFVYCFWIYAQYWLPFLAVVEKAVPEELKTVIEFSIRVIDVYHRFISFWLFILGFIGFIFCLRKGFYREQFNFFFRMQLAIFGVVRITSLLISNIFQGIIWFILPTLTIVINDTAAYVLGITIGRTPLISVSPRKTWEGFISGIIVTIPVAFYLGRGFAGIKFFTCPQDFSVGIWYTECEIPSTFVDRRYILPKVLAFILQRDSVEIMPFQLHSIAIAVFGSIIAPFGGFFASGLKRGLGLKDFSDVFPGHGGFSDRFDCQIMMAMFVFVYIKTFVKVEDTVTTILRLFMSLSQGDKMFVFAEIQRIMTQ